MSTKQVLARLALAARYAKRGLTAKSQATLTLASMDPDFDATVDSLNDAAGLLEVDSMGNTIETAAAKTARKKSSAVLAAESDVEDLTPEERLQLLDEQEDEDVDVAEASVLVAALMSKGQSPRDISRRAVRILAGLDADTEEDEDEDSEEEDDDLEEASIQNFQTAAPSIPKAAKDALEEEGSAVTAAARKQTAGKQTASKKASKPAAKPAKSTQTASVAGVIANRVQRNLALLRK